MPEAIDPPHSLGKEENNSRAVAANVRLDFK